MVRTKSVKLPVPTYQRFANPNAQKRFDDIFAFKELWPEKGFDISEQSTNDLPPYVHSHITARGWVNFCKQPADPIPCIVQEFYANFMDARAFRVKVRGCWVPIEATNINTVYGLPDIECEFARFLGLMEDDTWNDVLQAVTVPGTTWTISPQGFHSVKRTQLTPQAKVWHHFIKTRLMPTTHDTTVSQERMALLCCILTDIPINIGRVITDQLKACVGKAQGKLFFPCLITSLCLAAGVPDLLHADRIPNAGVITAAVIQKMIRDPAAEAPSPMTTARATRSATKTPEPPQAVPHAVKISDLLVDFKLLTDKLQADLATMFKDLKKDLTSLKASQHRSEAKLHTYFMYRKKFDKAMKITFKRMCTDTVPKFPKFPVDLLSDLSEADPAEDQHHTDAERDTTAPGQTDAAQASPNADHGNVTEGMSEAEDDNPMDDAIPTPAGTDTEQMEVEDEETTTEEASD